MSVDDRVATGEARRETLLPPGTWAGDVDETDSHAVDLDDEALRQRRPQIRLVRVAVDRVHPRADRAQLVENRARRDVSRVEDPVGGAQQLDAALGQPARAAREMRVRDDGDPRQG